jgi:Fe-S cluster assembly protein SufD
VSTAFVEQFEAAPPEGPTWLSAIRERAIARFQTVGFPTTRNEDWHFTSPAPITEARFEPMRAPAGTLAEHDIVPLLFDEARWPRLVFVNGLRCRTSREETGSR